MIRFWQLLMGWLVGTVFIDTPASLLSDGRLIFKSLFEDEHTERLAWLLYYGDPELLHRWFRVVLPASSDAIEAEKKLNELTQKREDLEAIADEAKASIVPLDEDSEASSIVQPLEQRNQESASGAFDALLSVGLSFMLFLGIAEYVGIDIQSIAPEKYFLVLLSVIASICFTVAAKKAIIKWVKATRFHEPQRTFIDDERYLSSIPFWARILQGDAAVWLTFVIVFFEMLFAAPGLIGFLPPKLATQFLFQMSAFTAAGLAAVINASWAWGVALNDIRLQQERQAEWKNAEAQKKVETERLKIERRDREQSSEYQAQATKNREYRQQAAKAEARLRVVVQQIQEQKREAVEARGRAVREHERWEKAVREWSKANKSKIERFDQEIYPQIKQDLRIGKEIGQGDASRSGNGYQPSGESAMPSSVN
jgi:hypothetical protein